MSERAACAASSLLGRSTSANLHRRPVSVGRACADPLCVAREMTELSASVISPAGTTRARRASARGPDLRATVRRAHASRSTTTCVTGTAKRARARSTTRFSSQFERCRGCVEITISSAAKTLRASSIAWSGSPSPISPRAVTPSRGRARRAKPRGAARPLRRRCPHPRTIVGPGPSRRDRPPAPPPRCSNALADRIEQRSTADRFVGDDENLP